jgi:hypothetical protein
MLPPFLLRRNVLRNTQCHSGLTPSPNYTPSVGETVFLYIGLRVAKRTLQKSYSISLGRGSIRWAGGETVGLLSPFFKQQDESRHQAIIEHARRETLAISQPIALDRELKRK